MNDKTTEEMREGGSEAGRGRRGEDVGMCDGELGV